MPKNCLADVVIFQPVSGQAGDIYYDNKSEWTEHRLSGKDANGNGVVIIYSADFNPPNNSLGSYINPDDVDNASDLNGHYLCLPVNQWQDINWDDDLHNYDRWCNIFDSAGNVAYKCYIRGILDGYFFTNNDHTASCSALLDCNLYGNDSVGYGVWTTGAGNGIEFINCVSRCNMTLSSYGDNSKTCAKKAISVPPKNCYLDQNNNWTAMKCNCNERYCTSKQPDDPGGNTEDRECVLKPDNGSCATPNDTFICDDKYYTNGDACTACPNPSSYGYSDYDYHSTRKANSTIQDCYMSGSYETQESTGTFEFTSDCYYTP